ncbi:Uncharacterized protein BP5553_09212 [Venustampulla echinocandica]|uniref:DUF4238 domain-containing protein n=1 Tax=Venustampulla echinocandica TaxID=2656787 RepID=A0A370TC26_9HELO|nr:Uncharacterized protein BP5553_09212 [Venustampulla echinocandica]RDL31810.1 Uncharacterized protein BP5553_09212 [Venustampulla echinocandica]
MATSSAAAQEKSQYHHFIPRFILRNYSHLGELTTGSRNSKNRGKQRGNRKNGPRAGEPVLYGVNLSREEPTITETTVAKTFGMMDMYCDLGASTKRHQVEEQLSVLESQAGEIISTIRKAFEAGKDDVWVTRTQRDTLRKFLFIMKYRGSRFHRRYFHENAEDYNADDREKMLKYMKEKGIKKTIDVWFDNIKAIIDLKMDYQMGWMDKLRKRIYPDDAEWCINNIQGFYMALITPNNKEEEFLLTQNAYSIFEGASTLKLSPITGKLELSAYTEFHLFAPIAPRLLIVLRSFILPVPEQDSANILEQREQFLKVATARHANPEEAGMFLRDLPITKALNSYSKLVAGKLVLINGGPAGMHDRFCFRFFPISEVHVQKINKVMLDESHAIDLIVFNSKAATLKTLVKYLAGQSVLPSEISRVRAIIKLEHAAKLLAATLPAGQTPELSQDILREENIPKDKVHALFLENEKATNLYSKLSGKQLDKKDFDQARALLYMRIKTDTITRGLSEAKREESRKKFLREFVYGDKFPAQVIWIYVKRIRFMKHGGTMINAQHMLEDSVLPGKYLYGAEDIIAASRDSIRKEDFSRLMFHASANGSLIAKPLWGLVSELTLDDNGMRRLHEEKELVLGDQGSICDCGILRLEEFAKLARRKIIKNNLQAVPRSPLDNIFTEGEKIELITREIVQGYKAEELGEKLVESAGLERALFDVVYPLFGSRQKGVVNGRGKAEGSEGDSSCLVQ